MNDLEFNYKKLDDYVSTLRCLKTHLGMNAAHVFAHCGRCDKDVLCSKLVSVIETDFTSALETREKIKALTPTSAVESTEKIIYAAQTPETTEKACPSCGENRIDLLAIQENDTVICCTCSLVYEVY